MKHSESLKAIAPAIIKMQGEVRAAIKGSENTFFKASYADLEACWEAVKPALQANGLAVVQTAGFIPVAGPSLVTTLLHISGEYITGEQPLCAKSDVNPQDLGSAMTYARRYGLASITGLIQVDDDGEGAMNRQRAADGSKPGDVPKFPPPGDFASDAQVKRLTAIQIKAKVPNAVLKTLAAGLGILSRTEIPKAKYSQLCTLVENYKPEGAQK